MICLYFKWAGNWGDLNQRYMSEAGRWRSYSETSVLFGQSVFYFLFSNFWDPRWWSNLLKVLKRPKTARGPNFNRWSISDPEICVKQCKPFDLNFFYHCGTHNHNPNHCSSLQGPQRLWHQQLPSNSMWISRNMLKHFPPLTFYAWVDWVLKWPQVPPFFLYI